MNNIILSNVKSKINMFNYTLSIPPSFYMCSELLFVTLIYLIVLRWFLLHCLFFTTLSKLIPLNEPMYSD